MKSGKSSEFGVRVERHILTKTLVMQQHLQILLLILPLLLYNYRQLHPVVRHDQSFYRRYRIVADRRATWCGRAWTLGRADLPVAAVVAWVAEKSRLTRTCNRFARAIAKTKPRELWIRAKALLTIMHSTSTIDDLRIQGQPPNIRLHKLKGDRREYWSVTIKLPWCITFK